MARTIVSGLAARRAAAAHVLFNLIAAAAALALFPALLALTRRLADALGGDGQIATALALFHTLFNVLGVLLMGPLANRLGEFLLRRFRTAEEDAARPRYDRQHSPTATTKICITSCSTCCIGKAGT